MFLQIRVSFVSCLIVLFFQFTICEFSNFCTNFLNIVIVLFLAPLFWSKPDIVNLNLNNITKIQAFSLKMTPSNFFFQMFLASQFWSKQDMISVLDHLTFEAVQEFVKQVKM